MITLEPDAFTSYLIYLVTDTAHLLLGLFPLLLDLFPLFLGLFPLLLGLFPLLLGLFAFLLGLFILVFKEWQVFNDILTVSIPIVPHFKDEVL